MNEETPRDRSGRLDIDSQEEARTQQFVIGNDEAELELSAESRSFVNWVNEQVRKRQKRISNVTENGEKHSMIWRTNVHDCNNGTSSIHGKELPEQLSIHSEHDRSHTQTNKCSTCLQDWCLSKRRSLDWRQLVGKIIHGNICH